MADVQENSRMERLKHSILNFFKENLKVIILLLGVALGIMLGFSLSFSEIEITPNNKGYIGFLGDILRHALKAVAVPVISGGIISTFGILNMRTCRKIVLGILIYLFIGKCCAAILCIPLCLIVHPGNTRRGIPDNETFVAFPMMMSRRAVDKYLDFARNLLPENWIDMYVAHYETEIINQTDPHSTDFMIAVVGGTNMLGVVLISSLLGIGLSMLGEEGTPLTTVFSCITKVCMRVSNWFTWVAPVGLMFLICRDIIYGPISYDSLKILVLYVVILWSCCIVQLLLIHPIIYFIFTRKNPIKIFINCPESFIISFGTASRLGTIPIAIKELVQNQKLDERIVNIVIPIGITVNQDGSFYMYVIGSIFEAQRSGRTMGVDLIIIVVLAFTMSMATTSLKKEGLLLLYVMWSTLRFQHADNDMALLFLVEYLCGRIRALLDVFGNIFCASVLDNFKLLEDADETA